MAMRHEDGGPVQAELIKPCQKAPEMNAAQPTWLDVPCTLLGQQLAKPVALPTRCRRESGPAKPVFERAGRP